MNVTNLFQPAIISGEHERFDTLLQQGNVTIERIHSPADTRSDWFDQPQDEWVLLLQGRARLEMADEILALQAGDSLRIPAHTRHRVAWTSSEPTCIWLAVHIRPKNGLGSG